MTAVIMFDRRKKEEKMNVIQDKYIIAHVQLTQIVLWKNFSLPKNMSAESTELYSLFRL